jgi:hypothetical protein
MIQSERQLGLVKIKLEKNRGVLLVRRVTNLIQKTIKLILNIGENICACLEVVKAAVALAALGKAEVNETTRLTQTPKINQTMTGRDTPTQTQDLPIGRIRASVPDDKTYY